MKTEKLSELLGPSEFSKEGYLGSDVRDVEEIIGADQETMNRLGVDKKKISAVLRTVYVTAERALGNPVSVAEGCNAIHHEARGRIPSPFSEDGTFQKGEAVVKNKGGDIEFRITPLSIHLIEKYGFFQGKGSPYRIEPDMACTILSIT